MSNEVSTSASGTGQSPLPEPRYDRKARFAKRVSVSPRCVDNWIRERRIPYLKIRRTVLIPWREALEILDRNHRVNAHGDNKPDNNEVS